MTTTDELSRLQTEQQQILDSAGEGIYGLGRDGGITFSNAAATAILGWKHEDVVGKSAHDVHRVDNEVFWHIDGSCIPVEYTSTPIVRDGKLDGAVVVFRDISDRKELQRQREEAFAEIKLLKD